jgi:hypothetical protein
MPPPAQDYRVGPTVAPTPIRAFLGTPSDITKFDPDEIAKDKTAPAFSDYGWGLYFTENRAIAEEYRTLGITGFMVDGQPISARASEDDLQTPMEQYIVDDLLRVEFERHKGDVDAIKASVLAMAEQAAGSKCRSTAYFLIRNAKTLAVPKGNLYEVKVDAKPENFIDFEAPLSKQSVQVQRGLEAVYPLIASRMFKLKHDDAAWSGERPPSRAPDEPAWRFHEALAYGTNHNADLKGEYARHTASGLMDEADSDVKKASILLYMHGIEGVRYADARIRTANDGTRKLVVFNPRAVTVVSKNGMALERQDELALGDEMKVRPKSEEVGYARALQLDMGFALQSAPRSPGAFE